MNNSFIGDAKMDYTQLDNVELGENVKVHEYVLLGVIPTQSPINPPVQGNLIIGNDSTIRSHTMIYLGNRIGKNFQTGHGVMIRENNLIGDDVSIGTHSILERENTIEDNVRIHSNCYIPEFVKIKTKAWLGPRVTILNVLHPPCPKWTECANENEIGENAKIGGSVTIGPRVKIGKNSLIGAGSVVISDVPDDSVAVGNPARVIKKVADLECDIGLYKTPYEWEVE
jgi:acetyltransferase-like isoleucine patch superfamily enzyme